jgi:hypothetical protein
MTLVRCTIGLLLACCSLVSYAACYAPLKARLPQAGIVIFGEVHGTKETPEFFLSCVREFLANNESVDVFLEIDMRENAQLRQFAEGKIDAATLLKAPHWKKQDGRASLAMLALLRALKELPGGPVTARGIDSRDVPRDHGMMLNLKEQRRAGAYALVLVGNVHASLKRGTAWNADYTPFAKYLVDDNAPVVSLNVKTTGGSAWVCVPMCGVTQMPLPDAVGAGQKNSVVLQADSPDYTGYFSIGSITASAPARAQ